MVGVVDVFGWEEVVWKIESIELLSSSLDIVLNTIAIGIKDWSTSSVNWAGCSISLVV
jgi:hypothetical protein